MPRRLTSLASLALALGACTTASGDSAQPGFSTAYLPDVLEGGAAPALHAVAGTGAGTAWAVGEGGATVVQGGRAFHALSPTGTTATLGGLDTLDVGHVFAVDAGGADVLAWTTTGWATVGASRADRAAAATWALAPNNLWVAGDGVEHWNGAAWTAEIPSGTPFVAMSGSFETDVWAVGPTGAERWDGHAWNVIATPTGTPALAAVWTADQFDTWIVGAQGTVLFWNGSMLSRISAGTTKDLTSVSGTSSADVWIGGADGTLLRWDGATWTERDTPAAKTIEDLWTAPDAGLLYVDGTSAVGRYVSQ